MIDNTIEVICTVLIFVLVVRLQIVLSKKDKKMGLIIPVVIFMVSLLISSVASPVKYDVGTSQVVTNENGEVVDNHEEVEQPIEMIDKSQALNGAIITFMCINSLNVVMLSIYFYYANRKKVSSELRRMKGRELY